MPDDNRNMREVLLDFVRFLYDRDLATAGFVDFAEELFGGSDRGPQIGCGALRDEALCQVIEAAKAPGMPTAKDADRWAFSDKIKYVRRNRIINDGACDALDGLGKQIRNRAAHDWAPPRIETAKVKAIVAKLSADERDLYEQVTTSKPKWNDGSLMSAERAGFVFLAFYLFMYLVSVLPDLNKASPSSVETKP